MIRLYLIFNSQIMKKFNYKRLRILSILLLFAFAGTNLSAQTQRDNKYKFSIDIPSDWTSSSYKDGTDKVYDYYSADQNAAVQLRVFETDGQVTTDLLAQVYESSMLPAGTKKTSLNDHVSGNGIPGKLGIYGVNYNGNDVTLATFYTVQNNIGYVLTAILPNSMIQQKGDEVKAVTKSFKIDGFSASSPAKKTKGPSGGGLGGTLGGKSTTTPTFKIIGITLTDQTDAANNPLHPTTVFHTETPEISAVVSYQGGSNEDLNVSWIYNDRDRVITSDDYTFDSKTGGTGVISLTKPTNGWPTGNYSIVFKMGGKTIRTVPFTVARQNSGGIPSGGNSAVAGVYNFTGRSDGKDLLNYWYITVNRDGTFVDRHQLKSGNYVSENKGTWKVEGDKLTLTIPTNYGDGIQTVYTVNGNRLTRKTDSGVIFTFEK